MEAEGIVKLNSMKTSFKDFKSLLSNSFIRIGLIKLVGYMSFCPAFQTN